MPGVNKEVLGVSCGGLFSFLVVSGHTGTVKMTSVMAACVLVEERVPIPTAVLRGSPVPQGRTSPQAWRSGPQLLGSLGLRLLELLVPLLRDYPGPKVPGTG